MRMDATIWSGVSDMALAVTVPPARAKTVFTPTARNSVLLPDMFEPLTIHKGMSALNSTSFRTHALDGNNG
jgi:hypothetical protein